MSCKWNWPPAPQAVPPHLPHGRARGSQSRRGSSRMCPSCAGSSLRWRWECRGANSTRSVVALLALQLYFADEFNPKRSLTPRWSWCVGRMVTSTLRTRQPAPRSQPCREGRYSTRRASARREVSNSSRASKNTHDRNNVFFWYKVLIATDIFNRNAWSGRTVLLRKKGHGPESRRGVQEAWLRASYG